MSAGMIKGIPTRRMVDLSPILRRVGFLFTIPFRIAAAAVVMAWRTVIDHLTHTPEPEPDDLDGFIDELRGGER